MATYIPPARIEDALHIAPSLEAGVCIQRAGGRYVFVVRDTFFPGPCDVNPVLHFQKRKEFFSRFSDDHFELGKFYSFQPDVGAELVTEFTTIGILDFQEFTSRLAAHPADCPIVLWAGLCLRDRLRFWWALDLVRTSFFAPERFWVAEPRPLKKEKRQHYHPVPTIGTFPGEIERAFAHLRPWKEKEVRFEAGLWQKFASPSPIEFDKARRKIRGLQPVTEAYGHYFPKIFGGRHPRLELSEADQVLLDALETGRWLRLMDMVSPPSTEKRSFVWQNRLKLMDIFGMFGDLFLLLRLKEWSKHTIPGVLMRPEPEETNPYHPYLAFACQLTPFGEQLRDQGLERPTDAPPIFVGGCQVYSTPTWVRHKRGKRWWIEKLVNSSSLSR